MDPLHPKDPTHPTDTVAREPGTVGSGVVLLTRAECHLCDAARDVVARVTADLGRTWREVSVTEEPELGARFAEELPVLFIDGVQRDFWSIDEARLRRLLAPPR